MQAMEPETGIWSIFRIGKGQQDQQPKGAKRKGDNEGQSESADPQNAPHPIKRQKKGSKKSGQHSESKATSKKQHDRFKTKWLQEFSWLEFVPDPKPAPEEVCSVRARLKLRALIA